MSGSINLGRLEAIIDASGVAPRIEALLPTGGRPRQLRVRTLLVGMLAALADGRPAHLSRVYAALVGLGQAERTRLGIVVLWRTGPHLLTYRQVERTFGVVAQALAKEKPDGAPSNALSGVVDALVEASVADEYKDQSSALAVDWSDHESFSRPPVTKGGPCGDTEASWGHRRGNGPGQRHELFFGYYLQGATMVNEEGGPAVAELARRILVTSAHLDPPRAFVPVMAALGATGVAIGDVLADSGYANRAGEAWAFPLRRLGAALVQDLHPHDRGPKGTFGGAIISNGNLYCPATPPALLGLGPLARAATAAQVGDHDRQSGELGRYKLGRITANDPEGYHRVACPAIQTKLRCPLRPSSMAASHERPEVLSAPEVAPRCCSQQTLTVGPEVHGKTAQKHDYPSVAHRVSYARRSAAERTFSTAKDPASNDLSRGWCRLMGLSAISLFVACAFVVRNERIISAFEARQGEDARRLAEGLPVKIRRGRRRSLSDLVAAAQPDAPP